MRDFQKSKVYAWEQQSIRTHPNDFRIESINDTDKYANTILKDRGRKRRVPVEPHYHKNAGWSWAKREPRRIILPEGWARCSSVVIHEVSHHLLPSGFNHREEFVSMYMFLLNRFLAIPIGELIDSSWEFGITHDTIDLENLLND